VLRWLVIVVALSGCATYSDRSARVREALVRGDLEKALTELPAEDEEQDVLRLLERGFLLFELGQHEASFQLLQRADERMEDLYTKSLSREAFAFLSNDATRPYEGMPHERVLLHLYAAENLLALGRNDSALVEVRRVGLKLDRLAASRPNAERYRHDGFAEWLAGLLYAEAGDGNGAMVSARRALRAYESELLHGGPPVPAALVQDHLRWARRFGFADEAVELAARYPEAAAQLDTLRANEGEVVLLFESGIIANLQEQRLDFPVLESDDDDADGLANVLFARGHRGVYVASDDVKLKYWLSVAIPVLRRSHTHYDAARLRADAAVVESFPVQDLSAIAEVLFEEGQGKRIVRTLARGIVKYVATKTAKDKNEGLGIVANVLTSLSERADTRSWSTLPDRIHMLRLQLPAGRHDLLLEVLDPHGAVGQTASFDDVEVVAGRTTFLRHRAYR
jgi:hypothetical protein